jgi:hypothetical protein
MPRNHASAELALPPIHPPARQLVTGREGPDVLLTVTGRLGISGLTTSAPCRGPEGPRRFPSRQSSGATPPDRGLVSTQLWFGLEPGGNATFSSACLCDILN